MDHEKQMRRDAAFARWYALHHHRIRSLCARILRDEAAGEDLAQETLLRAWTRRDSIRDEDVGAWLSVVARNACLSYLRKHQRTIPVEIVPELADAAADPSLILEKKEARKAVRHALNEVGERHRRALYLREVEEVGSDELGSELGLTPGGTRALLFRARAVMRERLVAAGQGLGAWLVGVRIKVSSVYRRARTTLSGGEAAPMFQAGVNLALAAGLAVASFSGGSAMGGPPFLGSAPSVWAKPPVRELATGPAQVRSLALGETTMNNDGHSGSMRLRAATEPRVEPSWKYDIDEDEKHLRVGVDAPIVGHRDITFDEGDSGEGHSIIWDDVANPTVAATCEHVPEACSY